MNSTVCDNSKSRANTSVCDSDKRGCFAEMTALDIVCALEMRGKQSWKFLSKTVIALIAWLIVACLFCVRMDFISVEIAEQL